MNDFDLGRSPSPYLLPAALEFLKLLGVPQPPPPAPPAPSGEARNRALQGRPPEDRKVEHALELLRQLSQELVKNPPTLHQAVMSNPTAHGQIYRRSLFVADEIELPEQAAVPVQRKPAREKSGKA